MNESDHTFTSELFSSVVDDAIIFFQNTELLEMPPDTRFDGSGVYALYYEGDLEIYGEVVISNHPIYIGKAVPTGWRTGRQTKDSGNSLYRRLNEHARSIEIASNLEIKDFNCRLMILDNNESDLIVPVEAELIRRNSPKWNSSIDGFGNHDPGAGRYNQAKSEWDVLHPGRKWVEKLTGVSPILENIYKKLK